MQRRWLLTGFALLALWALPAGAQDADEETADSAESIDYQRAGVYVGIGGQRALTSFPDTYDQLPGFDINVTDGHGWRGWLGYRMTRYFTVENELVKFEGFEMQPIGEFADALVWTMSGRVNASLPGPVEPFLSVGVGVASFDLPRGTTLATLETVENTAGVFKLAGGMEFFVTEHWALRIDTSWHRTFANQSLQGVDIVSVGGGLSYFFHFPAEYGYDED